MELVVHYSNRSSLSQAPAPPRRKRGSPARLNPKRRGATIAAITEVLREAGQPVRVSEIYRLAEVALGRPLSYKTLKDSLSAHAHSQRPRFRQVRRGWYELAT